MTEAQQVIAREGLGSPLRIYSPPTGLNIFAGIVFVGAATFVTWLLLSVALAGGINMHSAELLLFLIPI